MDLAAAKASLVVIISSSLVVLVVVVVMVVAVIVEVAVVVVVKSWPEQVNNKLEARASKYNFGARAIKHKSGARTGKYKLGVMAGGTGLGARTRTGAQAKGQGQGNTNILLITLDKKRDQESIAITSSNLESLYFPAPTLIPNLYLSSVAPNFYLPALVSPEPELSLPWKNNREGKLKSPLHHALISNASFSIKVRIKENGTLWSQDALTEWNGRFSIY